MNVPLESLRPELEQVQRLLDESAAPFEEPLGATLRRVLSGGKQLRPALVILVGQMFGAPTAPAQTAFCALAAAVSMLHVATLIHDDIVDDSPLRRGRRTLHTLWPAGAAVLAGDYLLGRATALLAELGQPDVLKVFAQTLCTMCSGEIRRALAASGGGGREAYYRNIEAKTATLFAAAAEMAGLLAGAAPPQIAALRRFGRELGMAYQIVDDVLDFTGDEAQLGKPAGGDLRQGVVTLPALYYLEEAAGDDTSVRDVLAGRQGEEQVQAALEAVRDSGAIEEAMEEARAYVRRSQEALAALPDHPARRALHDLAGYVVERRR